MVETWLLVFLVIYIRNRFIRNLERNNIFLYQQYKIKPLFMHWTLWPPLIMLFLYIIFEIMIFNDYRQILEYGTIYKQLTLLSYFWLVCHYELYNSMYEKYKDRELLGFITSPFMLAIVCLCVGYFCNYLAIEANSGHMPVFPSFTIATGYTDINEFTKDSFYILGGFDSKMIFFCDTIDLFGYSNLSIGDVFCRMYVFIILYFSIKRGGINAI